MCSEQVCPSSCSSKLIGELALLGFLRLYLGENTQFLYVIQNNLQHFNIFRLMIIH